MECSADFHWHDCELTFHSTDLCIDLPVFQFPVHQLVDGENHELRFTMKNRVTGQVYLVVVFSLDLERERKGFELEA